jgi:hypothetical protein
VSLLLVLLQLLQLLLPFKTFAVDNACQRAMQGAKRFHSVSRVEQMAAKEQQQNGQLPAAVTAKLQSLISGHVVEANDFDSHSLRQVARCNWSISFHTYLAVVALLS